MQSHDPYSIILDELIATNSDPASNQDEKLLIKGLKPYLKNLRKAYEGKEDFPDMKLAVDYSCRFHRAAYLLAYYPHHIEIPYHALQRINVTLLKTILNEYELTVCFLGAGPAPEALGLLQFLQAFFPQVKKVKAYLLDKYVNSWRVGQEITRYHLAPAYWDGKLTLVPLEFDFMNMDALRKYSQNDPQDSEKNEDVYDPLRIKRAIKSSRLVFMQNCINDQLVYEQELITNLASIFSLAAPGTLFLISDLGRKTIRNFLMEFENHIQEMKLGKILDTAKRFPCDQFRAEIRSSDLLQKALFETKDGLNERKITYFCSSLIERI